MPLSEITPQRLREWVSQSQPNARLVYAEGATLGECCPRDVRELVMDLHEKGWLTPHRQPRETHQPGARFLVQRTHRPFLKGSRL